MPWNAKRDALREDASYLVQTSAIDSLSAFPGDDTLAAAMRLSASRHPLVRGYAYILSLIHISEPTRLLSISYAVCC